MSTGLEIVKSLLNKNMFPDKKKKPVVPFPIRGHVMCALPVRIWETMMINQYSITYLRNANLLLGHFIVYINILTVFKVEHIIVDTHIQFLL